MKVLVGWTPRQLEAVIAALEADVVFSGRDSMVLKLRAVQQTVSVAVARGQQKPRIPQVVMPLDLAERVVASEFDAATLGTFVSRNDPTAI